MVRESEISNCFQDMSFENLLVRISILIPSEVPNWNKNQKQEQNEIKIAKQFKLSDLIICLRLKIFQAGIGL